MKGEKSVQIHVFYGEEQLYTSNGVYYETEAGEAKSNEGTGRYYDLPFADGTAKVYIYGAFEYKFYVAVELVLFGLSILLFFILLLLGIRDRIHYIRVLEGDIGVMEGGELQKPVTVQGDDELGTLAEKLEAMRLSLLHQGEAERRATEANRSLVTEMSHDLRTPLTSLLLYTQIVQNGKYKSEAEMQSYLEKIYGRAMQIKSQSDALFYHFLVDKDAAPAPLCDEDLKAVFPDVLSDFVCTLEKPATKEEVNAAFVAAAAGPMKGILMATDEPLVSMDFKGNPHSSCVDLDCTMVNGNMLKVITWYDNEWGYSSRVADLIHYMFTKKLVAA